MMSVKTDGPVLVTGATGYIAVHIIRLLLEEGYQVLGTVRDLKNDTKLKPLKNLSQNAQHSLELVEADLTKDDSWDEVAIGCSYCIHTASPLPNAVPEKEEELMVPAVEGTMRVLNACVKSQTVKRVVLTSSSSATEGRLKDIEVYTEDNWVDTNSSEVSTYTKSKATAEKMAWDFVRSLPAERKIELSVINPAFVLGPTLNNSACSSLEFVVRLMDGTLPLIPKFFVPFCDVRDVALAHLQAMIIPEAANNRHLIVTAHMWWEDIARILRKEFKPFGYFISTSPLPNVIYQFSSLICSSAKLMSPRLGKMYFFSDYRMKEVLKILKPYNPKDTLIDTANSLIECGVLKRTRKYEERYKAKK